jgi:hypothetical protein
MAVKSLASVDARIRELKAELQASPLYKELAILEEMRPKLAAINGIAASDPSPKRRGKQPKGQFTQHEAAEKAVEAAGHPLQIDEIVTALPMFGAVISGPNARPNLTSVLNKRSALHAVKWQGRAAWWFKNRALPEMRTPPVGSAA